VLIKLLHSCLLTESLFAAAAAAGRWSVESGGSGCPLTHAQFDVVRRMRMKKTAACVRACWRENVIVKAALASERLFPPCVQPVGRSSAPAPGRGRAGTTRPSAHGRRGPISGHGGSELVQTGAGCRRNCQDACRRSSNSSSSNSNGNSGNGNRSTTLMTIDKDDDDGDWSTPRIDDVMTARAVPDRQYDCRQSLYSPQRAPQTN